jgi:hypothetical protein
MLSSCYTVDTKQGDSDVAQIIAAAIEARNACPLALGIEEYNRRADWVRFLMWLDSDK